MTEIMTALTTTMTDAITSMQGPIVTVLSAGVAITLIFVGFRAIKSAFKSSTKG